MAGTILAKCIIKFQCPSSAFGLQHQRDFFYICVDCSLRILGNQSNNLGVKQPHFLFTMYKFYLQMYSAATKIIQNLPYFSAKFLYRWLFYHKLLKYLIDVSEF